MKTRPVTKKQKEKMNSLAYDLIKIRGEIIHWMTEIESELDELIVYNYIKNEIKSKFFEILMWEDFRFSTKIRLFSEIELPSNLELIQRSLVNKLYKLSSIRNKFAHRLSLITLKDKFLIEKKHKSYKVDNKMFKQFKIEAIDTLAKLRYILLIQNGINPKSLNKKLMWVKTSDIQF